MMFGFIYPPPAVGKESDVSLVGWMLLQQAATLRERVFARAVVGLKERNVLLVHHPQDWAEIYPSRPTVTALMSACHSHMGIQKMLTTLPHTQAARSLRADPELHFILQDLAEILAAEGSRAFLEEYYPGVITPEAPMSEAHVRAVMEGMQRELDREGNSRHKYPLTYASLPFERQRALAERRRMWFGKFGITPDNWQPFGTFNLWDVVEEEMPDLTVPPKPGRQ